MNNSNLTEEAETPQGSYMPPLLARKFSAKVATARMKTNQARGMT